MADVQYAPEILETLAFIYNMWTIIRPTYTLPTRKLVMTDPLRPYNTKQPSKAANNSGFKLLIWMASVVGAPSYASCDFELHGVRAYPTPVPVPVRQTQLELVVAWVCWLSTGRHRVTICRRPIIGSFQLPNPFPAGCTPARKKRLFWMDAPITCVT